MIPIWKLSGRLGNQMFQLAYLYSQVNRGEIPDIYVQGEEYFENAKDEVRALFGVDTGFMFPYIAIHVRRGDYVDNPFYVDLVKDGYYERAMKEFPGESFYVFSDDIEWCKKQSIFAGCEFCVSDDEIHDLNMMTLAKGIIIANSSFSWWAAYLGREGRKIVAPKNWYTDGVERTKLPKTWIRL